MSLNTKDSYKSWHNDILWIFKTELTSDFLHLNGDYNVSIKMI